MHQGRIYHGGTAYNVPYTICWLVTATGKISKKLLKTDHMTTVIILYNNNNRHSLFYQIITIFSFSVN